MNPYKITGLILFFSGFILFNALFFMGKYTVDRNIISSVMDEEMSNLFLNHNSSFNSAEYSSNIRLISDLSTAFEKVNDTSRKKYGLTEVEIEKVVEANNNTAFRLSILKDILDNSEAGKYKYQKFTEYGSWLENREFQSENELKNALINVSENINKYAIVKDFGFDRYEIKNLKYTITKKSTVGFIRSNTVLLIFLTFGLWTVGGLVFHLHRFKSLPGIKNDKIFQRKMTNGSWMGILTGSYLIGFYLLLYYFHEYMTSWIILVDPISEAISGNEAGQFFLYGFIYTLVILVMGVRMFLKYKHSKYQKIRTASVMFFQLAFAFLIPEILVKLNQPYYDFKNIWPLDYDFFFGSELDKLTESGGLGIFMLVWGIVLIVIAVPVLVYFFGKRWYCSWVCGCGGLAETAGDPYRQLSDKSLKSWKIERWMVHSVLVFAVVMTAAVLYTYFTGDSNILGVNSYKIRESYGAWIGAGFAGVVGTGFYPFMGNRVWCRFGCPLAAYLGLVQRFKSRFRITTNGGQCISCGNCSTYCEMGIDVRWYAQRGQNIIRSSCVGCGVCSSVCPRGVLNLEVKKEKGRFGTPINN